MFWLVDEAKSQPQCITEDLGNNYTLNNVIQKFKLQMLHNCLYINLIEQMHFNFFILVAFEGSVKYDIHSI